MISVSGRSFGNFFATRLGCVVNETLIKLDQHVSEMMTTAGKKFKNFDGLVFL